MLNHDGVISTKYRESRVMLIISRLINLVPYLLNTFCARHSKTVEHSLVIRFLRAYGEAEYAALSFAAAAVLLFPQSKWNNALPFAAFMAMLLLHWLAKGVKPDNYSLFTIHYSLKNPWVVLYGIVIFLSVAFSVAPTTSFKTFPRYASCLIAFYLFADIEWDKRKLQRIIDFIIICVAIVSLYGIYQRFNLRVNRSTVDLVNNPYIGARVYSVYENSNSFGFLLCLLLPFPLVSAVYGPNLKFFGSAIISRRFISGCTFIAGSAALVLTFSRGAWLAFAISMIIFIALTKPKLLPVFILLGVVALPLIPDSIFNRLMTIFTGDTSLSTRADIWTAGVNLFKKSPVLGAGLGLETIQHYIIANDMYPSNWNIYIHAHNFLLQVVNEFGIFGVLTFFGAFFTLLKAALRNRASKLCIACATGLIGILVCGIADYPISYPRIMLAYWVVLGITFAAVQVQLSNIKYQISDDAPGAGRG
jgi:O-antigen ligase